jgi:hypothetical protein
MPNILNITQETGDFRLFHFGDSVRWVRSAAVWLAADARIIHRWSGSRNVATRQNLTKGQAVNRHKLPIRHRFSDQPT